MERGDSLQLPAVMLGAVMGLPKQDDGGAPPRPPPPPRRGTSSPGGRDPGGDRHASRRDSLAEGAPRQAERHGGGQGRQHHEGAATQGTEHRERLQIRVDGRADDRRRRNQPNGRPCGRGSPPLRSNLGNGLVRLVVADLRLTPAMQSAGGVLISRPLVGDKLSGPGTRTRWSCAAGSVATSRCTIARL